MDKFWYRDKNLLRAAYEQHGSLERAALALGGPDKSTLQLWWKKLGLEKLPKGPSPKSPNNQEALRKLYERVYG